MLGKALLLTSALLTLGATLVTSPDPSGSWLSYAKFDAKGKRITAMNLTTVVRFQRQPAAPHQRQPLGASGSPSAAVPLSDLEAAACPRSP